MKLWSFIQSAFALATVAQAASIAPEWAKRQADVDATAASSSNATRAAEAEAAAKAKAAAALLASMPTCGRNCLVGSIALSPCALTDIACSCSNATITEMVEICVLQNCSVKQQLSSKNTTSTLCSVPVRDESHVVSYVGVIGGALALIAYVMRMTSRLPCFGGQLGWDDAIMTIAVLEVIPLTVFSVILANLGLGKDIWTVPFDNITNILKVYYFDEDLYLTALPMVKISMLLFYLRIFPQKWFKISCWVTMAACVGYGIAFLLVSVFQCRPISLAWHTWDGEHQGSCNDINAQGWTSAAFNVILDVIILALPLPVIKKLQLNKRKKFFVFLMFSIGFVVTIVSILRLQVLVQFGGSTNFTWHYRSVGYWSTAELDLAVICACMPGMRALIKWAMPKMMGASTRGQTPAPTPYGTNQSGPSYEKRSIGSRDVFGKGDKDWIPLVDVKDTHSTHDVEATDSGNDWPISEPKAAHRMSIRRHSSRSVGKKWGIAPAE